MHLTRTLTLASVVALSGTAMTQQSFQYERSGDGWTRIERGVAYAVDGRVVTARFADRTAELTDVLAELGRVDGRLAGLGVVRSNRLAIHDLAIPAGADPLEVVAALRDSSLVEFAEENIVGTYTNVPNDTQFGTQWNLDNTGQSGGTLDADVDATEAWDVEDGDASIVVAVLDSGSEWTHPDLASNIWSNPGETQNGADSDSNGYVDDVRGWDFDGGDNNPSGAFYHGTAVAGVIAAVGNNSQGISGLAGGANDGTGCSIMPLNVGSFSPIGAILDDAILYAADNGAHVITMSLQVGASAAIEAAIDYAHDVQGVFIDCASGNNGFGVSYPANLPKVMAVASTNRFDNKSGFSNAGPEVEIAAPGEDILMLNLSGQFTTDSGTSFAAPHVAGAAALVLSAEPLLTNAQVRQILRDSADDVETPGYDTGTGDGRLNAASALEGLGSGVPGVVTAYGQGVAGFNGQVPEIKVQGPPNQGQANFAIALAGGRPASLAYLLVSLAQSAFPFEGGTLLADITIPESLLLLALTDASGRALMPLGIPDEPALVGVDLFSQWVIEDVDGPFSYAFSGGLRLTVGSP